VADGRGLWSLKATVRAPSPARSPALRPLLALVLTGASLASIAPFACRTRSSAPPSPLPSPHGLALTGYHGGPARLGWNDDEPSLTPDAARKLAPAWTSSPFDAATVAGTTFAPHLYAAPLYVDDVVVTSPAFSGVETSLAIAATSNGDVYAVNAVAVSGDAGAVSPGTILWRQHLGDPSQPARSSDGVPLGILSTPVIDVRPPARLYVVSADAAEGWQAFALDLASGAILPGWPVPLTAAAVEAVNANASDAGVATFADFHTLSQRGALNLSPDGATLYVPFGSYFDGAIGWMVAVSTSAPRLLASFSGSPTDVTAEAADGGEDNLASGGMWGASGAAVAPDGHVFVTTGNSPPGSRDTPGVWGNSLLRWAPPLALDATYSPFNYCLLDVGDTDLGGGSAVLFDVDPARTSTPHLVAFGGKQGNAYLEDRDRPAGRLDRRPPCDPGAPPAPSSDTSLFGPDPRPYYAPPAPGPLNVFGPYSDAPTANELNNAKARTTPAYFRDASGEVFLYYSGNSRDPANIADVVAPSVARVHVVLGGPGVPSYLALVAANPDVVLTNPGSPVVSSFQSAGAVVWVVDANGKRTDALVPVGKTPPPLPVLYAFDAVTLDLLSRTPLPAPGGKYGHPTVAHGLVLVGADRLYAFRGP
jgi:hypothetical protein